MSGRINLYSWQGRQVSWWMTSTPRLQAVEPMVLIMYEAIQHFIGKKSVYGWARQPRAKEGDDRFLVALDADRHLISYPNYFGGGGFSTVEQSASGLHHTMSGYNQYLGEWRWQRKQAITLITDAGVVFRRQNDPLNLEHGGFSTNIAWRRHRFGEMMVDIWETLRTMLKYNLLNGKHISEYMNVQEGDNWEDYNFSAVNMSDLAEDNKNWWWNNIPNQMSGTYGLKMDDLEEIIEGPPIVTSGNTWPGLRYDQAYGHNYENRAISARNCFACMSLISAIYKQLNWNYNL